MRLIYQARRNLATGHVLDDAYEITMFAELIDPEYLHKRTTQTSLDGTEEVELSFLQDDFLVTPDLIVAGSQEDENYFEFISSVAGGPGEPFTFDPDSDQVGVDVSPTLVYMVTPKFKKTRVSGGFVRYPNMRLRIL